MLKIYEIFYSNNFLLPIISYRAMKNFSSQVPSGRIVCVLQNCCTRPSFVFEGILINCHLVVYFPFIVSANWESWTTFQETIISSLPCSIQSSYGSTKKKRVYACSLSSIYMRDRIIHGCSFSIWVFNDLLRQLLVIIAEYSYIRGTNIVFNSSVIVYSWYSTQYPFIQLEISAFFYYKLTSTT